MRGMLFYKLLILGVIVCGLHSCCPSPNPTGRWGCFFPPTANRPNLVSDEGKACCDECEHIYAENIRRLEEDSREYRENSQMAQNELEYSY